MKSLLNILHLEDNANDAELVKELLAEHHIRCKITCVQSAKDFEAALDGTEFDLILSDYKLPAFDGISALAMAQKKCPDVPYIFVSGNIGEERAIETLKSGATDYILKDRLLRLVSSVKRALREAQMKKEHRQLEEQFRHSQKMEVVGRLAGGIAHDFNNMLTVISGYTDFLMGRFQPGDSVYKALEEIHKAAERSAALTHQLLAFSRRQVLQLQVLEVNKVLAELDQMLRRLIGETIELTITTDPNLGRVKMDLSQLEQIILNLIVNARDAMPKGGKIILETRNARFDEEFIRLHPEAQAGEYILLSVKDSGQGMSVETKAHIFEPFFTTKDPGKGTGLGLATVFGIVNQSAGFIEVDSQPGKGSTFRVYLPKSESEPEVLERKAAPKKQPGSETILLVEDDAAVRGLARKILEVNGYKVLEAEDGDHAISVCGQYKGIIHLLLTDSVMPRMSGEDLSKHLAGMRPDMKVLFFSGYAHRLNQQRIMQPTIPFLQKPFTPEGLVRKVMEALEG